MSAHVLPFTDDLETLPYQAFLKLSKPNESYLLFECDHENATVDIMLISSERAEQMMDSLSCMLSTADAIALLRTAKHQDYLLEIVESPDHHFEAVPEALSQLGAW